ncbi:HepT-like ribonuclease domain-containing protein [Desertivirga xinjiangensis]|uniref:HepT-like ribonuclease domain-containing protein n=1 Tax=Desertivirga xinjiangensis TaxID=539206 RepID=UPI00210C583A|nr:HepT-like ribonuclease domain-containing protein [Pedobacter xinjiangensis]
MDVEVKAWLYDILNAINEIEGFFVNTPKEFQYYQSDLRTKRAVERNIEIIGEAMNRILKKSNSIQISNARKLVDVRNRIIHGYDSVSDEVIWGILVRHLPLLQDEVEKLLGE